MSNGPVALVTGGGRGIGRAAAVALAARGFDVVILERSANEDTSVTSAAVVGEGQRAAAVFGDIAKVEEHRRILGDAWAAFGRVDTLVNNAGVSVMSRGDLLDVSIESYDRCQAVNTRGSFFLTQAFAKRLLAEARSEWPRSIVFVTSSNAQMISVNRGEYCVSKAGASMVARLFATRLAGEGIGVYEVRPGIIRTEMTEPSKERYDRFFAEGGAPVPRWGEADEVGRCIATMAAGDLPYTVGQCVMVDGGLSLPRF
ncbi:MAG: 3-ketoacyl-ACP reductase [Geminicoccaceae bacterium]